MLPFFVLKHFLIKTKYWRRNDSFTFSPEVKIYLLIDSLNYGAYAIKRDDFRGNYLYGCHELTCQLISIVVLTNKHFWYQG